MFLLILQFLGCSQADLTSQVLSATGYTELLLDTEAAGVPPGDIDAVSIGGVPAYDLWVTAAGELALTPQGGPSGPQSVVLSVDGEALEVGTVTYAEPVDPVFDRLAAVGASVTMGFQDGAPTARAQLAGPVMHVARAAGAWLPLPLFHDDLWDSLTLDDVGPAPGCLLSDAGAFITSNTLGAISKMAGEDGELDFTRARVSPNLSPHNLAIGNFRIDQIANGAPPDDPAFSLLTYLAFENGSAGLGSETGPSQLDRLEALEPTMVISTDLYGNDIISSVLSSGKVYWDDLTEEPDYEANLVVTLERLAATGADVFLVNLPKVDRLPRVIQAGHAPADLAIVVERGQRFNQLLDEHAASHSNIHVVDAYGYVEDHPDGLTQGGYTFSMSTLGGLVSFDGIHFTDTGNALVAQLILDAITEELGVELPEVPLASVVTRDPHSPPVTEVYGRDIDACD